MKTAAIFALLFSCLLVHTGCTTKAKNNFSVNIEERTGLPSNFASDHFTEKTAVLWIENLSASYRRISFKVKSTETDNKMGFSMDLPIQIAQLTINNKPVLIPVFRHTLVNKSGGFTLNFAPRLRTYLADGEFCFEMPLKVFFAKNEKVRFEEDSSQVYTFRSMQSVLTSFGAVDTVTFCDERNNLANGCSNIITKTFVFRNRKGALEISSNSGAYKLDLLREDFGPGKYDITIHSDITRSYITAADIPSRKKFSDEQATVK